MKEPSEKIHPKKDEFYGKAAMYLSFGFWIPLFNIGLCAVAIYLAFKALKLADADPTRFDGRKQAVVALVLSATSLLLTAIGVYLSLFRKDLILGL
jgi:uncharacterized membrane protein